ncbi:hypothetical protein QAD02_022610 [Eretmocerus hayati]|uniref:Uncharacterized protein n=1 Tax=Eretmocerus hayati TaxID=131215 RepID=A0ACC2PVK9_9HYME|nr:hypothetical protein QAD02_022610 [Eretmocerus hayati]
MLPIFLSVEMFVLDRYRVNENVFQPQVAEIEEILIAGGPQDHHQGTKRRGRPPQKHDNHDELWLGDTAQQLDDAQSVQPLLDLAREDNLDSGLVLRPIEELMRVTDEENDSSEFESSNCSNPRTVTDVQVDCLERISESLRRSLQQALESRRRGSQQDHSQSNFRGHELHPRSIECLDGMSSIELEIVPQDCFYIYPYKFSRFNTVEETLNNTSQGRSIVKTLRSDKPFKETDRKELVRILIAELILAQNNTYPSHEVKEALAKALVEEFPRLKNDLSPLGYEHFYNPVTRKGFFQWRLQTLQKDLPVEEKKHRRHVRSQEMKTATPNKAELVPDRPREKVSCYNYEIPPNMDRKSTEEYLRNTHRDRRHWISDCNPAIKEIIAKCPFLTYYEGELIDMEFLMSSQNANVVDGFKARFHSYYIPRILAYCRLCKRDLLKKHKNITDVTVKALRLLVELLPTPNNFINQLKKEMLSKIPENDSKGRKHVEAFIKNLNPFTLLMESITDIKQLQTLMESKKSSAFGKVEPYIVCIEQDPAQYYIVADEMIMNRADKTDSSMAFDLLFKIYNVFNIQYPKLLLNFFSFIESFLYEMKECSSGVTVSLHINLRNINLSLDVHKEPLTDSDED